MEKIYKYTSMSSAIKILENNSVKLNYPENFNDPFDSIIDFDEKDKKKALSVIVEYYVAQEIIKLKSRKDVKLTWLQKRILNWNVFFINTYLYQFQKRKYYDSIPFVHGVSEISYRKACHDGVESVKDIQEKSNECLEKVKEIRKESLVSCFSKNMDSILMWSHYGDEHRGICIEFERPETDFYDVEYSEKRCRFDLEDTTRRLLGYMLSGDEVNINDKGLVANISKPFLVKSLDWKYEEEVRCILSSSSEGVSVVKDKDKDIFVYTMPTKITKIIVGCKANETDEDYDKLIDLAKKKHVEIIEMQIDDDKFAVNPKDT